MEAASRAPPAASSGRPAALRPASPVKNAMLSAQQSCIPSPWTVSWQQETSQQPMGRNPDCVQRCKRSEQNSGASGTGADPHPGSCFPLQHLICRPADLLGDPRGRELRHRLTLLGCCRLRCQRIADAIQEGLHPRYYLKLYTGILQDDSCSKLVHFCDFGKVQIHSESPAFETRMSGSWCAQAV